MMARRWMNAWRAAGALTIAVLLAGHVGTDDVFFAGEAGPWSVRVAIRQPGVIPGLADISIRVEEPGVDEVTVTARQTRQGGGEAPPPDIAEPVRGETGLYAAQLWLMNRGPHEVIVTVHGGEGDGLARIPIVAAATKQLEMARGLELFILFGGLFLVLGLLTIVGAASRESVLPAGEAPARTDRRRAWRATAVAAVVLALVLFGGWTWVRAEAASHRANLDRPWSSEASIRTDEGYRILEFAITEPFWVNRDDEAWRARNSRYRRADLVPDHGKMMHMFLVRDDLDAFAHIHPVRLDDSHFEVAFPPLPRGDYRVYADIAHEDGLSHTLSASVGAGPLADVTLVAPETALAADPDDAWWIAGGASGNGPVATESVVTVAEATDDSSGGAGARPASPSASRLVDGSVMHWLDADRPLVAGQDAELAFRVEDPDGDPVALDPYMGMSGHAMLSRVDGEVFVHLHPVGMISVAAQSALNAASGEMSGAHEGMDMADPAARMAGNVDVVTFPLLVPDPGSYRIWVQVRRGEQVLTGYFDTTVLPGDS